MLSCKDNLQQAISQGLAGFADRDALPDAVFENGYSWETGNLAEILGLCGKLRKFFSRGEVVSLWRGTGDSPTIGHTSSWRGSGVRPLQDPWKVLQ